MDTKPRSVKKEVTILLIIVMLFWSTLGLLVHNVIISVQALEAEKGEVTLDLGEVDKAFKEIAAMVMGKAEALTQLTKPSKPIPAQTPVPAAPDKSAEVKQIRFFESGRDIPPAKERKYSEQFSSQSRFIITEITYKNNNYQVQDSEIPITVHVLDAAGQLVVEKKGMARPKKDWASATYIISAGDPQPGWWKAGKYTVRVSFNGNHAGDYSIRVD